MVGSIQPPTTHTVPTASSTTAPSTMAKALGATDGFGALQGVVDRLLSVAKANPRDGDGLRAVIDNEAARIINETAQRANLTDLALGENPNHAEVAHAAAKLDRALHGDAQKSFERAMADLAMLGLVGSASDDEGHTLNFGIPSINGLRHAQAVATIRPDAVGKLDIQLRQQLLKAVLDNYNANVGTSRPDRATPTPTPMPTLDRLGEGLSGGDPLTPLPSSGVNRDPSQPSSETTGGSGLDHAPKTPYALQPLAKTPPVGGPTEAPRSQSGARSQANDTTNGTTNNNTDTGIDTTEPA